MGRFVHGPRDGDAVDPDDPTIDGDLLAVSEPDPGGGTRFAFYRRDGGDYVFVGYEKI